MKRTTPKAVIISISSDIGCALGQRWRQAGMEVWGTYRRRSSLVQGLEKTGVKTLRCDLSDERSVREACRKLRTIRSWDYLVLCPGTLTPVGGFGAGDFREWEKSLNVNFLKPLEIVHALLPLRNKKKNPAVIFFAGSGTNNAAVNYSAYTISKIALIKMCELLDAEVPDTSFVIVGPGWVKTKIHKATLQAGKRAGDNYRKTVQKLSGDECTPMVKVLDCFDWLIKSPRQAVGGRNFSVVFDPWGTKSLVKQLIKDPDMYKLRRHRNDLN
jgi:NAD(P)-dependent dehydrogenase (short-subunit alcohol dehydrogenase family)